MDFGHVLLAAALLGGGWWVYERIEAAAVAAQVYGRAPGRASLPLLFLLGLVLSAALGVTAVGR